MSPNIIYSPFRSRIPFSLIPVLPITEQIRIVQLVLSNLMKFDTSSQKEFLKRISYMKENKFIEIFNTCKPIGKYLWKYQNICFMYNPKLVLHNLFTEKKGFYLLRLIKNTLLLKNIEWVCLIQQETIIMFQLSSNGYLLWSTVLKGVSPYFIASILSDNSILESIDDSWRWKFLEKEKSQLIDFIKKEFKENLQDIQNSESLSSEFFFLIDNLLKAKENFIQHINKELNQFPFYHELGYLSQINKKIQQIINLQETTYISILEPLKVLKWNVDSKNNDSITKFHWILDIPPLTFLEIIPHIKTLSENQKVGEFYTPIALAETIVTRAFNSFLDQGLKKPITSLKVLDPAMGTGILLVFTIEWLVNLMILNSTKDNSLINLRRKFAYFNVKGIDIDKNSISIYRKFLMSFYLLEGENKNLDFSLENIDFIESFVAHSEIEQSFPKFDLILSNPPYLAFHSRFTKNFPSKVKLKTLRQLIPVFTGKRDNTYLIFLGICLQQFLAPEGVVGFVIDHSFLDLPSYKKIRKYLLSKYHVSFILSNHNYRKTATVDLSLLVIRNSQINQATLWQDRLEEKPRTISKEHFLAQPNCSFQYQEEISFFSHLKDTTIPLGDIASVSCGLEYGALLKTNFLSPKSKKGFYKCIDGSNGLSHPYFLFWASGQPNSYVRFDKEYERRLQDTNKNVSRTNKKVILISGNLNRFLTNKIILRQTAPKFISTIDKQKFLTLRNTHLIYHPKPPYSLYLILGILCSSLGNYLGEHFNIIRKPRKGSSRYPQIRLNDLKKFPIIDINQLNDTSTTTQVEISVKKCLNIGDSITAALTSLWNILLETGPIPISQRQFLKVYLNRKHLSASAEKIESEAIAQMKNSILQELSKLAIMRKEIDSLIFRLYKIKQQDQRKINSEL